MKNVPNKQAKEDFFNFLMTEQSREIYKKYGFEPPSEEFDRIQRWKLEIGTSELGIFPVGSK
jgi:hypothetical protein